MERRFAIVMGINNYSGDVQLKYCVNDAIQVKKELVNVCKFNDEDIYLITSDINNPTKDVKSVYNQALKEIRDKIDTKTDSILFYFAGHGNIILDKSVLFFNDVKYPIEEIYYDISQMNPKLQFYIIDSCHSGGQVLTRDINNTANSITNTNDLIRNYIINSCGTMFIYACRFDEVANEDHEKKHGVLTYHFLNALRNDSLYDSDGILTLGHIQQYILKETTKASEFRQNPVIENRITGYYPFAFKKLMFRN